MKCDLLLIAMDHSDLDRLVCYTSLLIKNNHPGYWNDLYTDKSNNFVVVKSSKRARSRLSVLKPGKPQGNIGVYIYIMVCFTERF